MRTFSTHLTRVLLFFALSLTLFGCAKTPNEKLLREAIDAMQAAGEARDVGGFMAFVSDDFSGQNASMDRRALALYMLGIRTRTENIGVTRTKTSITMQGERAKVEFSLLVTDGGKILPAQGQLVSAQTQWRFSGGAWQLASANWTSAF